MNAQVSIRSPCCRKWFDCADCHAETQSHPLLRHTEMVFVCKKCKKAFRKDTSEFEESDEYCPHCDNHFVLKAVTPQMGLKIESEDMRIDSRMISNRDSRIRGEQEKNIFKINDTSDRLG